ncbi:MAG TPA: LLM class flavin-dependent oxidoreductase [Acidimicrobiales bacterium]|nr:LLM class flavin-dependent oxidoreductase [Acidimicrobiales bacterium]
MTAEFWTTGIAHAQVAARQAERAEAAGFDGMVVVDSQNLSGDPYVALTLAAAATDTLKLGTGVTNTSTRHPAATAAGILSVHVASGGRAALGVGRGDSALAHLGFAPAPVADLEAYIKVLRAYLRGEPVSFNDLRRFAHAGTKPLGSLGLADAPDDSRIHWLPSGLAPVPVEVAASGPKVLAASRHADRVLLAVGADPARVAWARDLADAPATGAFVNVVAHTDRNVARDLMRGGMSTFARFNTMHGETNGPLTDDDRTVLQTLHQSYDMTKHTQAGSAQASLLTTDFADRFGIAGPPAYCVDRLRALTELGIDKFVIVGPSLGSDPSAARVAVATLCAEVLPALREA